MISTWMEQGFRHIFMTNLKTALFVLLVFLLISSSAVFAQNNNENKEKEILTIDGLVETPLKLKANDLSKIPRKSINAKDHDGKNYNFEGYVLFDVLKLAGIPSGDKLRGKQLANYLLVEAEDGYKVVFTLTELDPAFSDRTILLADKRDGKALSEKEGRLRIIVPFEKKQGRWVRQVLKLTIKSSE